jgi:hypothetical protein
LQIAGVLGAACSVLKPELIKLLRDDAEEVLQGLVPHVGQILVLLSKAGTFCPDVMVSTYISVIVNTDYVTSNTIFTRVIFALMYFSRPNFSSVLNKVSPLYFSAFNSASCHSDPFILQKLAVCDF